MLDLSYRVATKRRDVLLNPFKTKQDILNGLVASNTSTFQGQEAQRSNAVGERDHDSSPGGNVATVI